jgi:hypothetical protein
MYDLSTCEEILKKSQRIEMDDEGLVNTSSIKEDWKTRSWSYNRQLKTYHSLTMNYGVPFSLVKVTLKTTANLAMP